MNHRDPTRPPFYSAGDRRYLWGTKAYRNLHTIAFGVTLSGFVFGVIAYFRVNPRLDKWKLPDSFTNGPILHFVDEDGNRVGDDLKGETKKLWKNFVERVRDTENLKFWKKEKCVPLSLPSRD